MEHFINHLDIYTRILLTGNMMEMIVKIMAELISVAA